jgi:hypothetical protein
MSEEKEDYKGFPPDIWPQIQFHNERIYENLKLFIQITLAICGALAYLSVHKLTQNKDMIVSVIYIVAWLQIIVGLYTCLAIGMHVLSQIRRYKDKGNLLRKAIFWLEPYMILFVITISSLVSWFAYFRIAKAIATGDSPK